MTTYSLDPDTMREIADYVDALNKVTESHGSKSAYLNQIPVLDHHGDKIGIIVDEIGGVYQFQVAES